MMTIWSQKTKGNLEIKEVIKVQLQETLATFQKHKMLQLDQLRPEPLLPLPPRKLEQEEVAKKEISNPK